MSGINTEKVLDKNMRERINALGGAYLKLETTHNAGLPDRLCLLPGGKCFFIEVKTFGKKPRKIQLVVHRILRELGFKVYVLDHQDQIKQILSEYD